MSRSNLNPGRIEDRLIGQIDRAREPAPKPVREHCPQRAALDNAYSAYARKYGWPEAKGWAAAKAYWAPRAVNTNLAARADTLLFGRRGSDA